MSVNLNLKNRSITNVKQAQAHENTYGVDVNFVNSTTVMMLQINYMDGVKQAATLVFLLVYFFKYEMGYDNEEETKFLK